MRNFGLLSALALTLLSSKMSSAQTAESYAEQSYALSQRLNGDERLFYLTELTRVSTSLSIPEERGEEWCLELFRVASTTKDERLRIAGQKNALSRLSFYNPGLAIHLLSTVDLQSHTPSRWLYEDLRTNAAVFIFDNYLKKAHPADLALLAEQARYLGRTGQYPYRAVAKVIKDIPNSSADEANEFVNDALEFYARETGYFNRDEEFWVLLKTLRSTKVPVSASLVNRAFSMFAEKLTKDPIALPGRYYSEIHAADGSITSFSNRNEAFLFLAFPDIQRRNSHQADQLIDQNPKLKLAKAGMVYVSGGFVLGNPSSEEETRQHLQWIQESMVEQIKDCNKRAPELAARLSQRLTDVGPRIVGVSLTIPGMIQHDLAGARALYKEELTKVNILANGPEKAQALVALAQAAHSVGDTPSYESLSSQAQDMGIQLFAESSKTNPGLRVQRRDGFNELKEITTFAASLPSDSLSKKTQKSPDSWLKAYLLLYDAEGRAKSRVISDQDELEEQSACIE